MKSRDVALRYLQSFSSGDPSAVAAHVTEDFENRQVSLLGTGCRGADTYRERLVGFLSSFRNLVYDVEDIFAEGDRVAVAYTMRCDHDGRPLEIPGAMIITVRDNRVAARSDYWDGLTFLKQAGLDT